MKSIKGNYILGSALDLAFGIVFVALSLFWDTDLLVEGHYLYILGISALPALIFIFIFNRGHKPDEREEHIERKVYEYSWRTILIVLFGMYGLINRYNPTADWIIALACVTLISKGGFGLYFFIRE